MTQQFTVREARDRRKPPMTQEELAARAAIDQTYVSLIEAGKRVPSDDIKKRLAKALGISPIRLRFSEPQPGESVSDRNDKVGQGVRPTSDRSAAR